jgi:multiple sugar transport system substrate-binding protein
MLKVAALVAGASAMPLLQACGGGAASPTTAPASAPTTASSAASPAAAGASPTTGAAGTTPTAAAGTSPTAAAGASPSAAAGASPTTASAGAGTPTAAAAGAGTPTAAATGAAAANGPISGTATPASGAASAAVNPSGVKINGKLAILQEQDYNPIHNQNIHNEITQFAQKNNWPLDLSYMDAFVGGGDFYQKIAAAVSSGNPPDMELGTKDAFLLQNQNLAQPVDDVVNWAIANYGQPIPGAKYANVIDGKWYGVPFFGRSGGDWARKSWFDAVNFDISKQHNLQDFLDASVKVSDASKKHWGWGRTVNRSGDGQTDVYVAVFGAGGRFTDETGTKVVFNSDATIAAYQWLYDLYGPNSKYAAALPPGVNGWTDPSNNQAWIAGTIGFTNNAGTLFAQSVKQVPDIAKDTYLVPPTTGPVGAKQTYVNTGGATMNLFQGAKNPDAAKAVMEYLLSPTIQKQIWSTSSGYATPIYQWGWSEPEVTNSVNGVDKIFQDLVYGPQTFLWTPAPGPRLWVDAVDNAVVVTEVMADILKGTSVKDAVAKGQQTIQGIYDKYQGK